LEGVHRDLALVRVEDLDEARHVRTLELVGQADVHVEHGNGILYAARAFGDPDRVADRLDADLIDGELTPVLGVLDVGDGERITGIHESLSSHGARYWTILTCVPFPLFQGARAKCPFRLSPGGRGSRRRSRTCPGPQMRAAEPDRRGRRSGRATRAE